MFIDLGFAVFDAYNRYHALALLERQPEISLLFVDVRMPGMSGPQLAELVRQRRPDIKIVLNVGEEFLASGVHFEPKPWRVDQVAKAVGGCQA
jgi:CheY-like chemotaxis protein